MTRNGEKVNSQLIYIRFNFPGRLGCIGVKQDLMLFCDSPDFGYGLDGPHLVVGMHDGNQCGIRAYGPGHIFRIYRSQVVYWQNGDFPTLACEVLTYLCHCRMFNS